MTLPSLRIGRLTIDPPIIQGGMGVRVSGARLASAVANEGCAGVIASVGLGNFIDLRGDSATQVNRQALRNEIRKARKMSDGVIGVNVMVALSDYDELVRIAAEEKVDFIVSGAGLPLELPGLVSDPDIALIPIVSSARALRIICSKWKKGHGRMPDAVVVEGPRAGGHLGFKPNELNEAEQPRLEDLVKETLALANSYETPIPVIAAGGIFDGGDIARFLEMGASGVQMASRFVCTDECDVHDSFKQAYINASEGDMKIIASPVGMPARAVNNDFLRRLAMGQTLPFNCRYQCLRTCDPAKAPYCIARVLSDAANGMLENAFAFGGSNAPRCTEIVSVKALIKELVDKATAVYSPPLAGSAA